MSRAASSPARPFPAPPQVPRCTLSYRLTGRQPRLEGRNPRRPSRPFPSLPSPSLAPANAKNYLPVGVAALDEQEIVSQRDSYDGFCPDCTLIFLRLIAALCSLLSHSFLTSFIHSSEAGMGRAGKRRAALEGGPRAGPSTRYCSR